MKLAPSAEVILAGFPKKDHLFDAIPGTPEEPALNILIDGLHENAASIATLKGGRHYGHTALTVSPAEYATIQHHSTPFLMEVLPLKTNFCSRRCCSRTQRYKTTIQQKCLLLWTGIQHNNRRGLDLGGRANVTTDISCFISLYVLKTLDSTMTYLCNTFLCYSMNL